MVNVPADLASFQPCSQHGTYLDLSSFFSPPFPRTFIKLLESLYTSVLSVSVTHDLVGELKRRDEAFSFFWPPFVKASLLFFHRSLRLLSLSHRFSNRSRHRVFPDPIFLPSRFPPSDTPSVFLRSMNVRAPRSRHG